MAPEGLTLDGHKPKTYNINDFRDWHVKKELKLDPRFQRREVWSPKAKAFLIDTILRGLPIPSVYMRQKIDLDTKKNIREVVDGQQRIRAILEFLENRFPVSKIHNKEYGGLRFSELPDETQQAFLEYDLSADFLIGATDPDVLDVFARINSYTVVLNKLEKLNAKYNGAFKQAVFSLGREHLEFWISNGILTNHAVARMGEADLCTDIVVAMVDGIQDKKSVEKYYRMYEDEFPSRDVLVERFKRCIDTLAEILQETPMDSDFRQTAMFYSLFCVVYDLMFGLPRGEPKRTALKKESISSISKALQRLDHELKSDIPDPKYAKFKDAATRATADRARRLLRHEIIRDEILNELKGS